MSECIDIQGYVCMLQGKWWEWCVRYRALCYGNPYYCGNP